MISPMTVSRQTHVWWSLYVCSKWPNLFHIKMTKSFGVEIKDPLWCGPCNTNLEIMNDRVLHAFLFFLLNNILFMLFSRFSSSLVIFIPQFYSKTLLQFHSTLSDYLKLQVVNFFPPRITGCSVKVSQWNLMFKIVDNGD